MKDLIQFLQQIIKCQSVTPQNDGAIELLSKELSVLGFKCEILDFEGDGSYKVKNLYARYGAKAPNLCFAGHTDVVPVGNKENWRFDPFEGKIENDIIYGRGIVDMKGAIAAMMSAVKEFIRNNKFQGSISFLITGDEEGQSINGTKKLLKTLAKKEERLDFCLVGEPTSVEQVGDTIKVGRRGSVNFHLKVTGKQGHVAYPHNADNPITRLLKILYTLKEKELDSGTPYFEPSNLEVTSIDVGNLTSNVIPEVATANLNIRFNDLHNSEQLIILVKSVCEKFAYQKYMLDYRVSGESFITHEKQFVEILQNAVKKITGKLATLSTGGGTSDARFIKDYCPVIELGLINKTAHQVNEYSSISDILKLQSIYLDFLSLFFSDVNKKS